MEHRGFTKNNGNNLNVLSRGKDKEDLVQIYNYSHKIIKRKEIGSFVEMWMELELVIHGEEIKRKTNTTYCMVMHIYGI